MPQQVRPKLTIQADGQVLLEVGPYGLPSLDPAWFFDRTTWDDDHIRQNVRLAFKIGGYGHPASREYLDAVNGGRQGNQRRGMQLANGTYFVKRVEEQDGQYVIGFGPFDGQESYAIQMPLEELTAETNDPAMAVARNIKSFLRLNNHTSFTTAAINAVNAAQFWI